MAEEDKRYVPILQVRKLLANHWQSVSLTFLSFHTGTQRVSVAIPSDFLHTELPASSLW